MHFCTHVAHDILHVHISSVFLMARFGISLSTFLLVLVHAGHAVALNLSSYFYL